MNKITDDDESCDIEDDSCDIDNKIVTYRAVTGKKENRIFEGTVQLVSPKGISAISDIDDTLKITNVFKGKKELMKNTYLKEFTPVPGMADVYQHWRRRGRDGESDTEEGQLPRSPVFISCRRPCINSTKIYNRSGTNRIIRVRRFI